jgi:(E)-4-hydroxy-3-methylbut-2-enyl-diphosphate synthase
MDCPSHGRNALSHIAILEKLHFLQYSYFYESFDIQRTVEAYRLLSQKVDYPLHLALTEEAL